jgi:hypothetical protein
MIDEDQIIFTDNVSHTYHDKDNIDKSPTPRTNSNLGFDDCVKLNIFKKNNKGDVNWDVSKTLSSRKHAIPDNSLVFLTQSNQLLDSFSLKLKFDNDSDKKLKDLDDLKKKKYENIKSKVNENRNPNIKNLLKSTIIKKSVDVVVESKIKKLQQDYKQELDNIFSNNDTKSESPCSTPKCKSLLLEDSVIFEDGIQNDKKEEHVFFLTENNNDNKIKDNLSTDDSDESSVDKKIEPMDFEAKYKHLLTEDSNLTTKTSSTEILMQDEEEVNLHDSDKDSKKTLKKMDLKLPVIQPVDKEKVARDMRLTLFNSINTSESSLNRLNVRLDEIKQIHLPSFQAQFHQVCQYGDDSRIVKLVTEV